MYGGGAREEAQRLEVSIGVYQERNYKIKSRKILYQYNYEKIHQDLVTGCMLMIRKKMSRMTYSFFQLNEYSQTGIGQLRKDLEEKINEL